MRLPELTSRTSAILQDTSDTIVDYVSDALTPTIRLGVTGLARSGKTVFITSLIRALTTNATSPPLSLTASIPGFRAFLEPQPDDDVPRFAYEDHLAALSAEKPVWPQSTRRISQLRLTLEWQANTDVRSALGLGGRLHLDIIDYPGEWLLDLALLDKSYAQWSRDALRLARLKDAKPPSNEWLSFHDELPADSLADEQVAIKGAKLFTGYLAQRRTDDHALSIEGPGRFLLPGDLEGSPQLTFFPLDPAGEGEQLTPLAQMLERRYDAYVENVVKPFFKNHFARLDRQIVLIDILSALNAGASGLSRMEDALEDVLTAFRPGANSWLAFILGHRIDRILFAASKADHLHFTSHDRLAAVLAKAVSRAEKRASTAGAELAFTPLAGLKATEDVEKTTRGKVYNCIRGLPVAGETVDTIRFTGKKKAVIFPGDLPLDPLDAFDTEKAKPDMYRFVRFNPPSIATLNETNPAIWPNIGLNEALTFLIGDYLP